LTPVTLHPGDAGNELTDVVADLVAAGYARSELVEKRGDFAVRGGILDVFPPTEEHPLRVEFWGDEIEEIRYFKVADQRSLEIAEHGLWAPPCRELLLTEDPRAQGIPWWGVTQLGAEVTSSFEAAPMYRVGTRRPCGRSCHWAGCSPESAAPPIRTRPTTARPRAAVAALAWAT
jgi:hypothetical protein